MTISTGALTGDVDYVYGDVMEEYHQDSLPDPGTWIACEVSTIINPAHFYIVLPFGKEPLASLEPAKKEGSYVLIADDFMLGQARSILT